MSKQGEILILVSELNNRIHFLLRHVCIKIMGIRPTITNDKDAFLSCQHAKLNYSREHIEGVFNIKPFGLLYEKGVRDIDIKVEKYNDLPIIFKTENPDFPFDIFSAIFYFITRYEEYLSFNADKFKRFPAQQSLAFKNGFLDEPIVELWVELLKDTLKKHFHDIVFTPPKFVHIPTIDVDSAYAYLYKGIFRNTLANLKNLVSGNFSEIIDRFKTISGGKNDPYDNFLYLSEKLSNLNEKPVFFFLAGKYNKYDKNISIHSKAMQRIVRYTATFANVGMQPSYASNKKKSKLLDIEKQWFEKCYGNSVEKSRQHFIVLQFPKTYLNLIKAGITEDYSMGYITHPGFRAGTSIPFNFYDLSREKETTLKIFPFQVMDLTFSTYQNKSPEEATTIITSLMQKVKKTNGTFISLWHNDTLALNKKGAKWQKVFESVVGN
jgi:hypothetical protein